MTVADKLQTVAENQQKVYDAGIAKGYADGKESGDNPLLYAVKMESMYKGVDFPNDFEIKLDLPYPPYNLTSLFQGTYGIKKITLKGNLDKRGLIVTDAFRDSSALEIIDVSEFNFIVRSANTLFYSSKKLREIIGYLDFSQVIAAGNMFYQCIALEEVRVVPETIPASFGLGYCPKLSIESIQSIIDGLATVTTAQTLTLHTDIILKLTDEQYTQITNKNWSVL